MVTAAVSSQLTIRECNHLQAFTQRNVSRNCGLATKGTDRLFNLQDFISIFSAGNEGLSTAPENKASKGVTTVTSPATSKNCITVGATNTAWQATNAGSSSASYVVFQMSVAQPVDSGSQVVESYRVRSEPGDCHVGQAGSFVPLM